MLALTIFAGYYRTPQVAEAEGRFFFQWDISQFSGKPLIVDLGEHSWPKYLFQPGVVQISTRVQTFPTMPPRPVEVFVTAASSQNVVSLHSFSPNLAAVGQEGYRTFLIPGRGTVISFMLDIPYKHTKKPLIDTITVRITDRNQKYLLGEIKFLIVNSRTNQEG